MIILILIIYDCLCFQNLVMLYILVNQQHFNTVHIYLFLELLKHFNAASSIAL